MLITNDSDLKEPVAVVRHELGLAVGVINPHPPAKRSRASQPTFFKQLRGSALARCQFPEVVSGTSGKIHKPSGW